MKKKKGKIILITMIYFIITLSYLEIFKNISNVKFIGIFLMDLFMLKEYFLYKQKFVKKELYILISVMYLFGLISLLQGHNIGYYVYSLFYGFQLSVLFIYSHKLFESTTDILFASAGILLALIMGILSVPDAFLLQGYGRLRAYGGFLHPNTFGATSFSVMVGIILHLLFVKKNILIKLFEILLIIFLMYCCIKSDSRNAIYASIIYLILLILIKKFFINKNKHNKVIVFYVAILISGVSFYFLITSMNEDFYFTLFHRLNTIFLVNQQSVFNILFGNGLISSGLSTIAGTEFSIASILLRVGIIGICIYLYLFCYSIRKNMLNYDKIKQKIFYCLLIIFLLCSTTEAYIINITNVLPMLFLPIITAIPNPKFRYNE